MRWSHIFGETIRRLREMAAAGVRANDLITFIEENGGRDINTVVRYLMEAFLLEHGLIYFLLPLPLGEVRARTLEGRIAERRSEWEADPFPELMRVRDYLAFSTFAKEKQVVVVVCGANPQAGRWIGQPGVRCYDGPLFVVSREREPHAGLIAADPTDPRLQAALGSYGPPLSYDAYVERLGREGYRVLGAEDGYVIEDQAGHRLHEPYRIHSVYHAVTGDPGETAWTAREAEPLRAALNRHLGDELVRSGPHDDWEDRNDKDVAGPLWGPLSPVIEFQPEGAINPDRSFAHFAMMKEAERVYSRVYPDHLKSDDEEPS